MGAKDFFKTSDPKTFTTLAKQFDFILDTVSAPHDLDAQLELLKTDGTMILVGVPDKPGAIGGLSIDHAAAEIGRLVDRRIQETQEMLDFCAKHLREPTWRSSRYNR